MKSQTPKIVAIDCFPENVERWKNEGYTVVAVDVIRATTTAVTAVATGRRCYPVATVEQALSLASEIDDPLMVGEVGGDMPEGFEIPNSPALVARHNGIHRPMVLLSTSGTRIISAAKGASCYVACLRNYTAQIERLIKFHSKVAIIGAGTRGEFREEDQICCAWIAEGLLNAGYSPANDETVQIAQRWQNRPVEALLVSNSVAYLRKSGQLQDLEFVMAHVDDLESVFELQGDEIVMIPVEQASNQDKHHFQKSLVQEPRLNANV